MGEEIEGFELQQEDLNLRQRCYGLMSHLAFHTDSPFLHLLNLRSVLSFDVNRKSLDSRLECDDTPPVPDVMSPYDNATARPPGH